MKVILAALAIVLAAPVFAQCDDGDSDSDCVVPTAEPRSEERLEGREDRGESAERDGGDSAEDCEGAF